MIVEPLDECHFIARRATVQAMAEKIAIRGPNENFFYYGVYWSCARSTASGCNISFCYKATIEVNHLSCYIITRATCQKDGYTNTP